MSDLPGTERRSSPRRPPQYAPGEINKLRITRVHFRDQYLFCLLSDGNIVCVPLAISATLKAALPSSKYRWQVMDEGRTVAWYTRANGFATERLSLKRILAHPDAQIMATSPG